MPRKPHHCKYKKAAAAPQTQLPQTTESIAITTSTMASSPTALPIRTAGTTASTTTAPDISTIQITTPQSHSSRSNPSPFLRPQSQSQTHLARPLTTFNSRRRRSLDSSSATRTATVSTFLNAARWDIDQYTSTALHLSRFSPADVISCVQLYLAEVRRCVKESKKVWERAEARHRRARTLWRLECELEMVGLGTRGRVDERRERWVRDGRESSACLERLAEIVEVNRRLVELVGELGGEGGKRCLSV